MKQFTYLEKYNSWPLFRHIMNTTNFFLAEKEIIPFHKVSLQGIVTLVATNVVTCELSTKSFNK